MPTERGNGMRSTAPLVENPLSLQNPSKSLVALCLRASVANPMALFRFRDFAEVLPKSVPQVEPGEFDPGRW